MTRNLAVTVFSLLSIAASDASAMYAPSLGRFISRDPIGYEDGPNMYQYVRSSPLHHLDPTGTEIFSRCPIHDYISKHTTAGYHATQFGDGYVYHHSGGYNKGGGRKQYIDEILAAMMNEKTLFRIKGANRAEILANLQLHIDTRLKVISNAQSKRVRFGTGRAPAIPAGTPWQEAWEITNRPENSIACLWCTQLVFFGGTEGGERIRTVSTFIPGDWGYVFNDAHQHHDGTLPYWKPGLEGENVIYMTEGLFWGHFGPQAYKTQQQWSDEIRGWTSSDRRFAVERGKPRWDSKVRYPPQGLE